MNVEFIELREPPRLDLETALKRVQRAVDPETGIIERLRILDLSPDDPPLFFAAADIADTSRYNSIRCPPRGGGAAITRDRATMRAAGEAFERYCSSFFDEEAFLWAPAEDLSGPATPLSDYALFAADVLTSPNFPYVPVTNQTLLPWVQAHSLVHKRRVWVPAAYVYVPFLHRGERGRDSFFDMSTSNGLACGSTFETALLSALCEIIERDAVWITWYRRNEVLGIELDSATHPETQRLVKLLRRHEITVQAVLCTLDIPMPVVAVFGTRAGVQPYNAVGAAAALNPEIALLKAVEEMALTWYWAKRLAQLNPGYVPERDYSDLTEFRTHTLLYSTSPMTHALDFMLHPRRTIALAAIEHHTHQSVVADLQTILGWLRSASLDVLALDLTTRDVAELGFRVVRAICPGLQPLDPNFNARHLLSRRLLEVPTRLDDRAALNPFPCPFP